MKNLAHIHPISAIFGTVATAILMVAEYAVSSGRTGPPMWVDVFETFLPCDFLTDVQVNFMIMLPLAGTATALDDWVRK
jgi:hypothetical protein